MGPNVTTYGIPFNATIDQYREAKIEILGRDFKITLTDEEAAHADTLKTESQINQFCTGIINRRWG